MLETAAAAAGILLIAGGPVLCLRRRGAAWRWFGLGIASWALALCAKLTLNIGLFFGVPAGWPATAHGALAGLVSAVCELGLAALFLRRRALSAANVLAFGAGIGSIEVFFTLGLGAFAAIATGADATPDPMPPAAVWLFFLLERAITLVGHVSSRVLVYVALRAKWLFPALMALILFASVDGVAAYGDIAGWEWSSIPGRGRFILFLAVVGAVEAALAAWTWRQTD
jgi:membrane protein YdbS with pleckstrin-like domain